MAGEPLPRVSKQKDCNNQQGNSVGRGQGRCRSDHQDENPNGIATEPGGVYSFSAPGQHGRTCQRTEEIDRAPPRMTEAKLELQTRAEHTNEKRLAEA